MKTIHLLLASLFLCSTSGSAVTLVQQGVATAGPSATTASGNFASAVTAGNCVIALVGENQGSGEVTSIKIGASETLSVQVAQVGGLGEVSIYSKCNVTGGATAFSASIADSGRVAVNFSEWSGLTNASAAATNSKNAIADSAVTTNSVTPGAAVNLIIAVGGWSINDYSSGPTNSFTRMTQTGGSGGWFIEGAYLIQAAASAGSTGWTLTAGIAWGAAIATYSAPNAGPSNTQRSAGFFMNPAR